jgi:glucosamine--fructose-6-phosphate aminotransferase (isomerizing)
MKHGPIALIDERMPLVAIAPHDHVFEKMIGNVQEAKARGAKVLALTTPGGGMLQGLLDPTEDFLITIPESHPLLTPVLMVVPLQLLAYHIAVRRGCDVDQPRNLAKSVTVDRVDAGVRHGIGASGSAEPVRRRRQTPSTRLKL